MALVSRFDHVGITVPDLDTAAAFFTGLGFEEEGRADMAGEFVDTVIGIAGSRSRIVMLSLPGQDFRVELSGFEHPDHRPGSPEAMSNEIGLRNICFEVDDLDATLDHLAAQGYGLVGGVGEAPGSWRMTYVRGPGGIIVALAQRLG